MLDQISIFLSGRALAGALVLAGLLVPGTARSAADWDDTQRLEISSGSFTQVLFYDYQTMQSSVSSVNYGDWRVPYSVRDGAFVGAFLFDYSEQRFTTGFSATTQSF